MSQRTTHIDTTPLPPPPPGSVLALAMASKAANNSNLSSPSPSGISPSGALPSTPIPTHGGSWHGNYTHSSKCDGCHTNKHNVLQRCTGCTIQYCKACMPKARDSGHDYDETKLDWDPKQASPTFRERGSMKKMIERGETVKNKSRRGMGPKTTKDGLGVGEIDEDEEMEDGGLSEHISRRSSAVGGPNKLGSLGGGDRRGSIAGTGGRTRVGSSVGMGDMNERLMTEAEKYQSEGYDGTYAGGLRHGSGPISQVKRASFASESRRGTGPLSLDNRNTFDAAQDVGGYGSPMHPNKRQRQDIPSLERRTSHQGSGDGRFDNELFISPRQVQSFDNHAQVRTQTSSSFPSNNGSRPPISQQPGTRPSQASMASSRREPTHHQQYQDQAPTAQRYRSPTIRRAGTFLNDSSSFKEAVEAVLAAQQDQDRLPARRREFEAYCRDRWRNDPVLVKLREEGQNQEAEDLYLASKDALRVAYFGADDQGA